MSIMQGHEEGFNGFQNIRVICGPLNWYQFAKILTLAHGLYTTFWEDDFSKLYLSRNKQNYNES